MIPVYNEENTIEKIINKIKKAKLPKNMDREIIVVDDGSTDKTARVLKKISGIRLISHIKNQGKGAGLRSGFREVKGSIVLIQDADLEYNPNDYSKLLKPILEGNADVIYGSRLKDEPLAIFSGERTPLPLHYIANKFLSALTNLLYGSNLTDMETCYKVFKREVLKGIELNSDQFDFEPEFTAKVLKRGYKIREVAIKVKPRSYEEGKKITWKDGFIALWTLLKYRFVD